MTAISLPADAAAPIAPAAYLPINKVFAVGLGNALEFYDFLTFSFFAVQIGHCFFPASQTTHGLLYTLATFGLGFVTRPLGGLIIGRLGDRVGRKPAMLLTFMLMGVAITGLALTPSYAQIGIAAPILLLLFRLVQGFALGGEVGPSTAFLIEAAPPHRRGLYLALQFATQDAAILAAGLVGFALSSWLAPAQLDAFGWRIAFLLGASIVPVGLMIRRTLPETLVAHERETAAPADRRVPIGAVALGLMMLAGMTICAYGLQYIGTYAQDSLHLSAHLAFGGTICLGLCSLVGDFTSGPVSDRFGRKPVMLTAAVLMMLVLVPAFMAMHHVKSALVIYAATAVLSILQGFGSGPALMTTTELLPKLVRSSTLGTLYAVAISVFGGSTQFVVKWLGELTGDPLTPGWYMTGALAVAFTAMLIVRETAPVKTGRL